jgi:hypothetical protein
MLKVLLYIWQFPQILLALILIKKILAKRLEGLYRDKKVYCFKSSYISGVSLGEYIILREGHSETTLDHEYGHTVQSRIFGPLYLIVIGIPSAVFNNLWDRKFHKTWTDQKRIEWYYSRYPEKWADRLGGVNRFKKL